MGMSVRLSILLSIAVTPKRFMISKYTLHRIIDRCLWFLGTKFRNPEFSGERLGTSALKRGTPFDSENLTNT